VARQLRVHPEALRRAVTNPLAGAARKVASR
jgi:hypothetical protein